VIPRAVLLALIASVAIAAEKPHIRLTESEIVERGLVIVRLDPKLGAAPGECDDLAVHDLAITVGGRPAKPTTVERVPRPLRHWLLVDISESAEGRREEAKRSAVQYVREVMTPGVDSAAVISVDEDPILVAGPSADPAELAHAIDAVPRGGWSALRDGLDTVLREVQGDRHEHLVLYWTDGEDQRSSTTSEELFDTLARSPNATVFPIALLPKGAAFPAPPLTGATFTDIARRSGGEVLISSDPRWLDRVRGWIRRRFTVGFVPPEPAVGERASRSSIQITVPQKRCLVTLLDDPFARPDPVAGAAPPAPPALVRLRKSPSPAEDVGCPNAKADRPWEWPLRAERDELVGCMLDIVRSPGPYVREATGARSYSIQLPRVLSRNVRVLAPDLSQLPTNVADVVDAVIPDDPDAPAPFLMEGNALLGQRARIATSLFAARADYHTFALQRLQRFADDELRAIQIELSRAFPTMPAEQIAAAARDSRAGRRAIEAGRTPTDADVARVLAAWIRDVPAADVLRDLERRFIDTRIRNGHTVSLEQHWSSIRGRFAVPSRTRIETPLAVMRDPQQDLVGFVRVLLPRPERFFPPEHPRRSDDAPIDARLPLRPLALLLVESLTAKPELGKHLAAGRYQAVSLRYEPLEAFDGQDPARPFGRARVLLTLQAASNAAGAARVELDADVDASAEAVAILRLRSSVTGDPVLASLLEP
jgi:hypothetical protein